MATPTSFAPWPTHSHTGNFTWGPGNFTRPDPTSIHRAEFTLNNTLGAIVIGFAVACVVYGILLTQGWSYFRRFSLDSSVYKFLVAVVLILETADQTFIGHFVYFYTVLNVGNPRAIAIGTTTWSILMQQAVGSIVGTIVKCSFATRVYRFSERNPFITSFIILLSLGQLAVALIFTIQAFSLTSIPAVFQLKTLGTISLGLGVLTDVVTAGCLCFFLQRLRTGYKPADSLIRQLVRDAVNTGVLTTAVSLSTLLLFNFYEGNLIFAATYFLLSKLYAISFLATLNSRRAIRGRGTDAEGGATDYAFDSKGPSSRRPTSCIGTGGRSAQEETNIFHLGTRAPSIHENEMHTYPYPFAGHDLKPGFPPESVHEYERRVSGQFAY